MHLVTRLLSFLHTLDHKWQHSFTRVILMLLSGSDSGLDSSMRDADTRDMNPVGIGHTRKDGIWTPAEFQENVFAAVRARMFAFASSFQSEEDV